MAGYSGYSKSNNALQAESEGKLPLTHAARETKIPAVLIKRFVRPCEWHHTSCKYNATDYYDLAEIRETFAENPRAITALAELPALRVWRRINKQMAVAERHAFDAWLCATINADRNSERSKGLFSLRNLMLGAL